LAFGGLASLAFCGSESNLGLRHDFEVCQVNHES
jgi:hypothetical protein